jgi:hypothetical protein
MFARITIGLATVMILTYLPGSVYGHDGSGTTDGPVHNLEHVMLALDDRLVILGAMILAVLLVVRMVRHRVSG